jgi:hypothetical protein
MPQRIIDTFHTGDWVMLSRVVIDFSKVLGFTIVYTLNVALKQVLNKLH